MLDYLVKSKVRRRLLLLLWGEQIQCSVTALADRAGVAFAGVHGEVKAMQRARLVVSRHDGEKTVYAANFAHPQAPLLKSLVNAAARPTVLETAADRRLKRKLVSLGAPLQGLEAQAVAPAKQVETLLLATRLARRDPTVARCLPLCFWNLRDALDVKALAAFASSADDKHTLGFFLELTGSLGGDRRLVGLAESLRDRRVTSQQEFFDEGRADASREFALARKWGFRMNMDLAAFQTLFAKFVR